MSTPNIALVTGIQGQDGPYLAKFLLEKGYIVYGLTHRKQTDGGYTTDYLGITDRIKFVFGNMTDSVGLRELISQIQPTEVYNLAAKSSVASSWEQNALTMEVNAMGTLHLLNAIKNLSPHTKYYQASSSEMFGNQEGSISEKTPLAPRSPYAVSKVAAYWLVKNFREGYGLFGVNGITFNHESPLRNIKFVTRKITDGVAKIKLGMTRELTLGNLDTKRDWGFAGDYVDAMWRMLQAKLPDDYIICTGETHSLKDFLEIAFTSVGIDNWQPFVRVDSQFKRPAELWANYGDSTKARTQLNWSPTIAFPDLVRMMVQTDIARLSLSEGKKSSL